MSEITKIPVSYIIYTDGTNYYAKNGDTGVVEFQGTIASSVIQSAINAMDEGESLFIKYGTYNLNSVLNVTKGINIIGEGIIHDAVPYDMHGTILKKSGNVFSGSLATTKYNPIIKNIGIDGIDQTGIGLTLRDFHGILENVIVMNCNYGIDIQDCWRLKSYNIRAYKNNYGGRLHTSGCSGIEFFGSDFNVNNVTGMIVEIGHAITFFGCDFEYNGVYGLSIEGSSVRGTGIIGCHFEANPYWTVGGSSIGAHIRIGTSTAYPSLITIKNCLLGWHDTNTNIIDADRILITHGYNITIENSIFYQSPGEPVRTDIDNDQGSNVDLVLLNCREIHDGDWVIEGVAGIKAIKTTNFLTENSGTITLASGQYFAHNCDITPTWVHLERINSTIPTYFSSTITPSSIGVWHSAGAETIDIAWKCGV